MNTFHTYGVAHLLPSTASIAVVLAMSAVHTPSSAAIGQVSSQTATHSADTNRDRKISLSELTRVIELYNTKAGTIRTGCYKVWSGSEDNFAPAPERSGASETLTSYHSADSNSDGKISLFELTRVIYHYNTRVATVRTGGYYLKPLTEDGFESGSRFNIVIDVNQISALEALSVIADRRFSEADGIWVYKDSTLLSENTWVGLLNVIKRDFCMVTEDAFAYERYSPSPFQTTTHQYFRSISQIQTQAFVYIEDGGNPLQNWPWEVTLHFPRPTNPSDPLYPLFSPNDTSTFDQIACASSTVAGVPLLVHVRGYWNEGPRFTRNYVDIALTRSEVGGACYEFNPTKSGAPVETEMNVDTIVNFIQNTLGNHKQCYLLLPPRTGETDYTQSLIDTLDRIKARHIALGLSDPENPAQSVWRNSKLYIVLAAYVRPGTNVAFLPAPGISTNNSVSGASELLHAFRLAQ